MNASRCFIEQIKAELREEILKDLTARKASTLRTPWDDLKDIIFDYTADLTPQAQYALQNSISGVIRHALGISNVSQITKRNYAKAKYITLTILTFREPLERRS